MELFENRKLIIATKHQKEKVIAPLLEKSIGVQCFVNSGFDTDSLGTFTGEIERELDPISTVRKKCQLAMQLNNCDLGIASEGSFGQHPSILFTPADDEFIIFIDLKNKIEILSREISIKTNFHSKYISSTHELEDFAKNVLFPSHAIILRKNEYENLDVFKGITQMSELKSIFNLLNKKYGEVYAETDMRAMHNPTRMEVIESATKKLIKKINSCCPSCNFPGFDIVDYIKGLPCEQCNLPTQSTKKYIYGCLRCEHKTEQINLQKKYESPMYCDFCNP